MNKQAHTPGPWHVNAYTYLKDDASPTGRRARLMSKLAPGMEGGYIINSANHCIAELKASITGANDARMIASAPELLEALLALYHVSADLPDGKAYAEAAEQARAAIAKATGTEA